MKTRSGRKYDDKKTGNEPLIKSPAKEPKAKETLKARSVRKRDDIKSVAEPPIKSPPKEAKTKAALNTRRGRKYEEKEAVVEPQIKSPAKDTKIKETLKTTRSGRKIEDNKSGAEPQIKLPPKETKVKETLKTTRSARRNDNESVAEPQIESLPKETKVSPISKTRSGRKNEDNESGIEPQIELQSKETKVNAIPKTRTGRRNEDIQSVTEPQIDSQPKETKVSPISKKRSGRRNEDNELGTDPQIESPPLETKVKETLKTTRSGRRNDNESVAEPQIESQTKEEKVNVIPKTRSSRRNEDNKSVKEPLIKSPAKETKVKETLKTRSGRRNEDNESVAEPQIKSQPKEKKVKANLKTKTDDKQKPIEEMSCEEPTEALNTTPSEPEVTSLKPIEEITSVEPQLVVNNTHSEPEVISIEDNDEMSCDEPQLAINMTPSEPEVTTIEDDEEMIIVEEEPPVNTTPSEPEVSSIKPIGSESVKRKSTESDESPKPEAVKRLRVSRFTVPPIPQICGQLHSFGEEIAGELGPRLKRIDDIKLKSNEPSIVTDRDGLALDNIVSVVCGAMHSSCLSSEGEVITFGCNDDSALGRDTQTGSDETDDSIDVDESEEKEAKTPKLVSGVPPVIKMTAGDMHTCALSKEGVVYVWGNFKDESKKFGLFADTPKSENSDDFNATTLPKQIQLDSKIIDIASGCHHILLLTEDGDVLSFGEGSKGQLGRIIVNDLQSIAKERPLFLNPQRVDFGVGVVIEKVWANHWSSYAKSSSGDIYVWGLNNYHQLGFKSSGSVKVTNSDPNESQTSINLIIELKPTKVEKMPANVVMIANGQHHMIALDSDGQVFSCGSNTYGKLGYKTDSSDLSAESPQMISKESFDGQKVTHIACGEFCSFAITEAGHLMAWGQGSAHIGSEDFTDREVPTRVKGSLADSTRFVSVSSGSQHSLLIGNKTSINGN